MSLDILYDTALEEEQATVRETPTFVLHDHLTRTVNCDR